MVFLLSFFALVALGWVGWNFTLDALWQPTDHRTISQILEALNVDPGDVVYDLGCGDGRWLTHLAKERDARAIGIEIDPFRVIISRLRLYFTGTISRGKVIWGDMYEIDLSGADAIIMFLSEKANAKLAPKLNRELTQGTKIASFYHELPGWEPIITRENRDGYEIYIYRKD